jgi:hypothetical protein
MVSVVAGMSDRTPADVLEALRGYSGWDAELDALAVAAGDWLPSAYDTASARFWAAATPSSLSSMTVRVFGPDGSATGTAAFLELLRLELMKTLRDL